MFSLARVRHFEFLAESRLLSLLVAAGHAHRPVHLAVGGALDIETHTPQRLANLFRDTLGGLLLAQMASTIVDSAGEDQRPRIRRMQADIATERRGILGFGREWAAPIVDVFGGPAPSDLVMGVDSAFESLFRERVNALNLGELTDIGLSEMATFSYEAFDNTRRHGAATLDNRPIQGLRFILQRAVNVTQERLVQMSDEVSDPAVGPYLTQLADQFDGRTQQRLVELTVCDSGVGIPARIVEDEGIYSGSHDDELAALQQAFRLLETSSRTSAGRGRGLDKMLRAARELDGLLVVRCGRTLLHRSFAAGDSDWRYEQLSFTPGTAVSLLSAWRPDRQLVLL